MSELLTWAQALYFGRVDPKLRRDSGATTLEYVIIAAIVCVVAVVVATLIGSAISNYGSQIPNGGGI
jgi:Flp pilus assembly pilin Flp